MTLILNMYDIPNSIFALIGIEKLAKKFILSNSSNRKVSLQLVETQLLHQKN